MVLKTKSINPITKLTKTIQKEQTIVTQIEQQSNEISYEVKTAYKGNISDLILEEMAVGVSEGQSV
jgi:hypothetical protein